MATSTGDGRYGGEHLTTAGLEIESCHARHTSQSTHVLREYPGIAPRRTFLRGTPLKPGKIPPVHRDSRAFGQEIIKAGHVASLLFGRYLANPISQGHATFTDRTLGIDLRI